MTKSSPSRKLRNPKVFNKVKALKEEALKKHFGTDGMSKLTSMTGWELAHPSNMKKFKEDPFLDKIHAVSLQLLPKITGIRALWENLDEVELDDSTKELFRSKLDEYITGLKSHSAYDVVLEYAMGHQHLFSVDKAIMLLEKIALGLHAEEENHDDSTGN